MSIKKPEQQSIAMSKIMRGAVSDKLGIPSRSRILIAVSGGMDSAALLHLFANTGIEAGVAHVNFKLRGEESDHDEIFVKTLAHTYGLPFYCQHFDTADFASLQGISIQMAARQLRYKWFEKIATQHQWDFVATAHHLDDQIETFFINLLRGTGIGGLKGIPAKSGIFIRPLIDISRNEIEKYVRANRLDFREDSSNISTDYLRNRIRHQLLPVFENLQPSFRKIMAGNLCLLSDAELLYRKALHELKDRIVTKQDSRVEISFPGLFDSGFPNLLLYEILHEYGFNSEQTQMILKTVDAHSGKTFYSANHRLIRDREVFILQPISETSPADSKFVIEKEITEIFAPLHLMFHIQPKNIDFHPVADPAKAFLDYDTLNFPLRIRKWKQGDKMKPLGMKGHMKLSDFFTANKFSIADKEQSWLLTDSSDQIVWIIGHRIADQNRIKSTTQTVFTITVNGF